MKRATVLSLGFCATLAAAALAANSRFSPMEAVYEIAGESIVDPGPEEKKDRVAIYISGDAARRIYKAMPVPEERVVCNSEGSPVREKTAGGLTCMGDEKGGYECGVRIKLDDGTTDNAFAC